MTLMVVQASAQNRNEATSPPPPEVEWYPPEIDKGLKPDHARVIISGRTSPGATVRIDSSGITKLTDKGPAPAFPEDTGTKPSERQLRINCSAYERPNVKSRVLSTYRKDAKVEATEYSSAWMRVTTPKGPLYVSRPCFYPVKGGTSGTPTETLGTRANAEGFFEMSVELTPGMTQIPILVLAPGKAVKTYLLAVDVSVKKDDIKMNAEISRNKPPAAAKKIRVWGGLGVTYQSNDQITVGSPDLKFKTFQSPGILGRGGYWGDRWGIDFYFRDAPGKIEVDAPFQVQSDTYHWKTMEAKGLYQFQRGPASRIWGLPSQWQLRFGTQQHQVPFMDIDGSNQITVQDHKLTMMTLGVGLLLAEEQTWSYEFAFSPQIPLSSSAPGGTFSISSPVAYEFQMGAAYKIAPNWRLGIFSYSQSLDYTYKFQKPGENQKTGTQTLFYTTFDLRLGFEY